jgi:malonyl-ACP decarboxylase
LTAPYLNATKSLIGHGLSAAGTVEVIATLLQMKVGRLHPTRNLQNPIDSTLNWVGDKSIDHPIENALTLSMGFGGINTALCWQHHYQA